MKEKYKVILTPLAEKDIGRISGAKLRYKIFAKAQSLAVGPRSVAGCKKLVRYKSGNYYRVRSGKHRIVFQINAAQREISVVGITQRGGEYKDIDRRLA